MRAHNVALSYKPEEQANADDTRALVEAEGRRCPLLPGNLRSPDYYESLMAQTVAQLGKLHIVVSNATEQFGRTDVAKLPTRSLKILFKLISSRWCG